MSWQISLAVIELELEEAVPELRRHLPAAGRDVRPGIVVALGRLGDQETLRKIREEAQRPLTEDPESVRLALMGLAAFGDPAVQPLLREAAAAGGEARLSGLLQGLEHAEAPPDSWIVEQILRCEQIQHPALVAGVLLRTGEAMIPFLVGELEEATDANRVAFLIGCLGVIATDAAREAILAFHSRHPQLVEQQIRLLDLGRRRRGLAS